MSLKSSSHHKVFRHVKRTEPWHFEVKQHLLVIFRKNFAIASNQVNNFAGLILITLSQFSFSFDSFIRSWFCCWNHPFPLRLNNFPDLYLFLQSHSYHMLEILVKLNFLSILEVNLNKNLLVFCFLIKWFSVFQNFETFYLRMRFKLMIFGDLKLCLCFRFESKQFDLFFVCRKDNFIWPQHYQIHNYCIFSVNHYFVKSSDCSIMMTNHDTILYPKKVTHTHTLYSRYRLVALENV